MADDTLIYGFHGEHRFLSNFWPVPRGIMFDGLRYPTVEHAYQAGKTDDPLQRKAIQRADGPIEAKAIGRHMQVRDHWDQLKLYHMECVLRQKFQPGTRLAGLLVRTGTATLVEANTWGDKFWGKCRGQGKNNLGKILMEVRDDLRTGYISQPKELA